METLNINPKETRKTFWHIVAGFAVLVLLWRLPEIIAALKVG